MHRLNISFVTVALSVLSYLIQSKSTADQIFTTNTSFNEQTEKLHSTEITCMHICIHLQRNTIYIHILVSSREILNINQLYEIFIINEFNIISFQIYMYLLVFFITQPLIINLSFLELIEHIINDSFTSSATTLDTVCTLVMRVGG